MTAGAAHGSIFLHLFSDGRRPPLHEGAVARSATATIVSERFFTASDFAARDLAYHGALYGWASHSPLTALFRPPLRSRTARNVFFVGGTTHPGGGIPLVLLSGKMVAEMIEREAS